MGKSRQFELLCLLLEGRVWTAPALAERLEVSVRTVYRDLDALSAAGIPVYAQQGRGGGVRLLEEFLLDRTLLSPDQQEEVLSALRALGDTGLLPEAGALGRLSALFRREGTAWLEMDFAHWGEGAAETFRQLKEAILSRRVVRFTYYGSGGRRTERTVEPLRLRCKGGGWYLRAWCRERADFRLFRLNRMAELTVTEEHFLPRPGLPADIEPAANTVPQIALRLRFAPRAAYRVWDSFLPAEIQPQTDGSFLVDTAYPPGEWVTGFLLSFGDQVEVLSPEWVRRELARTGEKIMELYGQTGQRMSGSVGYTGTILQEEVPNMETMQTERRFCQSCGMPLDRPEDHGTEADGTASPDYCHYCYQGGKFPEGQTMEDIIQFNLRFNEENGHPMGTQAEAEAMMRSWFPTLKRWKH